MERHQEADSASGNLGISTRCSTNNSRKDGHGLEGGGFLKVSGNEAGGQRQHQELSAMFEGAVRNLPNISWSL